MMHSLKVVGVLTLAALAAYGCGKRSASPAGGSKKNAMSARSSGQAAVSRATDDAPTSNRKDMYVDHYRFGDSTDADGVVVRETSVIPPGSTAAMSFYVRNVATGAQVRIVWNDLAKNAAIGEQVKPVGGKGFVAFEQANPLPEGNYRVNMYYKQTQSPGWSNLGTHEFKVGNKS